MITEIMMWLVWGGTGLWGIAMASRYKESAKVDPPKLAQQPLSDVAELVVELLRSDEGWSRRPDASNSLQFTNVFEHASGVLIGRNYTYGFHSDTYYYNVAILDDEGTFKYATLSADDERAVGAELAAYETRRENLEQRRLTQVLAKRIVSGVYPVLAESADNGRVPSADGNDDLSTPATAGLLTYDASTKQIIASVRGDSVKLDLDASLRKRYDLVAPGKMGFISTFMGVRVDSKEFLELMQDKDALASYRRALK